ncbi:hypothetical protein [Rhodothermus marinus]|uniref:hypothetical protein n=1 Tax=Rhodothermus marinus TaxID=29549 RepID=UPI001FB560A3|nr:hypothetical protein [Rhodothermus marinus]
MAVLQAHQRHVDVAVVAHHDVAGAADVVGHHQRTEAFRERNAAVVWVAGQTLLNRPAVYAVTSGQ